MSEGMTGRLPELSEFCQKKGSAWLSADGTGEYGWEELPYWLKGFGDLGYLLEDERIITETKIWIEAILTNQQPDGYFGSIENRENDDLWPNMIALDVLRSYYEYTEDERVLPFMTKYFRWQNALPKERLLPDSWQKIRAGDNLYNIYWLYNQTGDAWLLDLSKSIHENTVDWTRTIPTRHGVNICQGFREPAQYYQQSKSPVHLQATERNYHEVMDEFGQVPGGMFGADENCRPGFGDPRQGAETCSMVELMRSNEILIGITGNPIYADRTEEIAFNSLPAAMTPDLKGLHYFTAPNMVQLDAGYKAPGIQNSGCMFAYSPWLYRCCQHNVSHGWPYFTEHLWMAARGNGLVAVHYSPCVVEAQVGTGSVVRITEETGYPFRETIQFTIKLPKPERFPLYLRIPGWCNDANVSINGEWLDLDTSPLSYLVLNRVWENGDQIGLRLPMKVRIRTWEKNHNSVSIDRGPLTYSLKIGERWNSAGKSEQWPSWEVYPTTPWNYGLVINPNHTPPLLTVNVSEDPLPDQPFSIDNAPIQIQLKARRIPAWKMSGDLVGRLQPSPARTEEPEEVITLIPMGCARLRITAFPTAGSGPDSYKWTEPAPLIRIDASHLPEGATAVTPPLRIGKAGLNPFVWPGSGGTEWLTYIFEKPRLLNMASIVWFENTNCQLPASWKLMWKDGEEWKDVHNLTPYPTIPGRRNQVAFQSILTRELRLVVELKEGASAGIYEWRNYP